MALSLLLRVSPCGTSTATIAVSTITTSEAAASCCCSRPAKSSPRLFPSAGRLTPMCVYICVLLYRWVSPPSYGMQASTLACKDLLDWWSEPRSYREQQDSQTPRERCLWAFLGDQRVVRLDSTPHSSAQRSTRGDTRARQGDREREG